MNKDWKPLEGVAAAIPARKLTKQTCEKFRYYIGELNGQPVQIANYTDGQKIRTKDKKFSVRGDLNNELFGRHLWRDKGKRVIVTEGEIDAMSISQIQDHKWPVVSIPNGSAGTRKALAANLEWLRGFEEVVLCFDMDAPGQKAVKECATLFKPGQLKVVSLPLKDANEMLVADRVDELVQCLWNANVFRPDGIVKVSDIREKVLTPPSMGMPWCLPRLTEETFGRRLGELCLIGAGTGIGKTTYITQQIAQDLLDGLKVGVFAFEQTPQETVQRVAGQMVGKTFHVPDGSWSVEELDTSISHPTFDNLYLYDHFGACDWETVRERIRYLRHAHDVTIFYIDHLTAMAAAAQEEERVAIDRIMAEIGGLVKELGIWVLMVSHLTTPDGTPHEEGGRVTIRHFKGSRAIGFWAHFMFGMERDQQSDNEEERDVTVFRVLKDRYTGRSTGLKIKLSYDVNTGLLKEADETDFPDATSEEPF